MKEIRKRGKPLIAMLLLACLLITTIGFPPNQQVVKASEVQETTESVNQGVDLPAEIKSKKKVSSEIQNSKSSNNISKEDNDDAEKTETDENVDQTQTKKDETTDSVSEQSISSDTSIAVQAEDQTPYAILYEDGTLIFQYGDTPDADYGKVIATFTDFADKKSEYPWLSGAYRGSIKSIIVKDAISIKTVNGMFSDCHYLTSVDLTQLNISQVTSMYSMFYGCDSLKSVSIPIMSTAQVTNMSRMFYGCSSLQTVDLSTVNTSAVTDMSSMFYGCSSLKELNFSTLNTSAVTNMSYMLYGCKTLKSIDLSKSDVHNVTNTDYMFANCAGIASVNLAGLNFVSLQSMQYMFNACSGLKNIILNNLKVSNATNMRYMLAGCSSLQTIDFSDVIFSKMYDMSYAFSNCTQLKSIVFDNLNTSNVTNMSHLLEQCRSLKTIDFGNIDTSNVTDMSYMFSGCNLLKTIDFGNIDTSKVIDMSFMFYRCSELKSLDVSAFDTSNVKSLNSMFSGTSITYLDLSNFNFSSVNTANYDALILAGCNSVNRVTLGSMTVAANIDYSKLTDSIAKATWYDLDSKTEKFSTSEIFTTPHDNPITYVRKYSVAFRSGSKVAATKEYMYGDTFMSKDIQVLKKDGYTFSGWYNAQDVILSSGGQITDTVYYAKWVPINYHLVLGAGLPNVSDIVKDLDYTENYVLTDTVFERNGYYLVGWNTKRDGSGTSYAIGQRINKLCNKDGDNFNLYAVWEPVSNYCIVTFDENGGDPVDDLRLKKGSYLSNLPTTKKSGFTFINWHENSIIGNVIQPSTYVNKDTVLVAEWRKNPIITFASDFNDDVTKVIPYNHAVGKLPDELYTTTKPKSFIGWFTRDGEEPITSDTTFQEDTVLYAHYGYKPVFDANNGLITELPDYSIQEDASYTIDSLPIATRSNYSFSGWFLSDGTQVQVGNTLDLSTDSKITAHWEEDITKTATITVKFKSGSDVYKELKYYIKEGKQFCVKEIANNLLAKLQYFKNAIGSDGKSYMTAQTISDDVTITCEVASISKNPKCTLTFNATDGIFSNSSDQDSLQKQITIGEYITYRDIPAIAKDGYEFAGWYTQENGHGTLLTSLTCAEEDTSYYPYFTKIDKEPLITNGIKYTFYAQHEVVPTYKSVFGYNGALSTAKSVKLHFELNEFSSSTGKLPVDALNIDLSIFKKVNGKDVRLSSVSNSSVYNSINGLFNIRHVKESSGIYTDILYNSKELTGGAGFDVSFTVTDYFQLADLKPLFNGSPCYYNEYNMLTVDAPSALDTVYFKASLSIDTNSDGNTEMQSSITSYNMFAFYTNENKPTITADASMYWKDEWGDKPVNSSDYFFIAYTFKGASEQISNEVCPIYAETSYDLIGMACNAGMPLVNNLIRTNGTVVYAYPKTLLEDSNYKNSIICATFRDTETLLCNSSYTRVVSSDELKFSDIIKKNESASATISSKDISLQNEITNSNNKSFTTLYQDSLLNGSFWFNSTTYYSNSTLDTELVYDDETDIYSSTPHTDSIRYDMSELGNLPDDSYCPDSILIKCNPYNLKVVNGQSSYIYLKNNDYANTDKYFLYLKYVDDTDYTFYKDDYLRNCVGAGGRTYLPKGVIGYKITYSSSFYSDSLTIKLSQKLASDDMESLVATNHALGLDASVDFNISAEHTSQECNVSKECIDSLKFYNNSGAIAYQPYLDTHVNVANFGDSSNFMENGNCVNFETSLGINTSNKLYPDYIKAGIFYFTLPDSIFLKQNSWYLTANGTSKISSDNYTLTSIKNWKNTSHTLYTVKFNLPFSDAAYVTLNIRSELTNADIYNLPDAEKYNSFSVIGQITECSSEITTQAEMEDLDSNFSDLLNEIKAENPNNYVTANKSYSFDFTPLSAWFSDASVKTDDTGYQTNLEMLPSKDYSYRLSFFSAQQTSVRNIKLFDILDKGAARDVDGMTTYVNSDWYGRLKSVDISSIESITSADSTAHCKPVLYYSTASRGNLTQDNFDLSDDSVWSTNAPADLSTVTAIAVDCSKNDDGSDFVLNNSKALAAYVNLESTGELNESAYNESFFYYSSDSGEDSYMRASSKVTLAKPNLDIQCTADPVTGTEEDPAIIFKDSNLSYSIKIENKSSDITATNVLVEDSLPEGLQINWNNINIQSNLSGSSAISSDDINHIDNKLTLTIPNLDPGTYLYINIPTLVKAESGNISNFASIKGFNDYDDVLNSNTTYHKAMEYKNYNVTVKALNNVGDSISDITVKLTGKAIYSKDSITPITFVTKADEDKVLNLEPGSYTLTETSVPSNYIIADPVTFEVSKDATIVLKNSETVKYHIQTKWLDGNNQKSSRPNSYTLDLCNGDSVASNCTLYNSDWYMDKQVPKYDNDDQLIDYTIANVQLPNYSTKVLKDGNTFTIVNTLLTSVPGVKLWQNDTEEDRPESVSIKLLQNGVTYRTTEVTAAQDWKYTFSDVPAYSEDGQPYSYSFEEEPVDGYAVRYKSGAKGFDLTFDYQSEDNYDYFQVYYKDASGQTYVTPKYGSSYKSTVTVEVPSTEFWVSWYSDGSTCNYYGMKLTNAMKLTSATTNTSWSRSSLPSYSTTEVTDLTKIETPHTYNNNMKQLWHYKIESSDNAVINHKISDHPTHVKISTIDSDQNAVIGSKFELLDSSNDSIYEWVSTELPTEITDLDPGDYTIHQTGVANNYFGAEDIPIKIEDTEDVQEYSVVNEHGVILTVKNTVSGSKADKDKMFSFNMMLKGDNTQDSVDFTDADGSVSSLTKSYGSFLFSAKANTSVSVLLKKGTQYKVIETNALDDRYQTTTENAAGIIDEDTTALFNNRKEDWYLVTYRGRTSENQIDNTAIVNKFVFENESAALTEDDLAEHPELEKLNADVKKYLEGSATLPENILHTTASKDVSLTPKVIVTYKDFDSNDVLRQDYYRQGYGRVELDFSEQQWSSYLPIYGTTNSGTFTSYTYSTTKLSYDTTIYLKKKDNSYRVRIKICDSDNNSLSDQVHPFVCVSSRQPNYSSLAYDLDSDSFTSDYLYNFSNQSIYIDNDWEDSTQRVYESNGTSHIYCDQLSFNVSADLSAVSNVVNSKNDYVVDTAYDPETQIVTFTITVPLVNVTELHNYYNVDDSGNPSDLVKTIQKQYKLLYNAHKLLYKHEIPGYTYYGGDDGTNLTVTSTNDITRTFNYKTDPDSENAFQVIVKNWDDSILKVPVELYDDQHQKVQGLNSIADFKSVSDGSYSLVVSDQPMGTLVVAGQDITFEQLDAAGAFSVQSAELQDDLFTVICKKKASTITVIDDIDGVQIVREHKKYAVGDTYKFLPLSSYASELYDSPSYYMGTATEEDQTFVFKYNRQLDYTTILQITVYDIFNSIHGSDDVMIQNDTKSIELPVQKDGSYLYYFVPDGLFDLRVNDINVGTITNVYDTPSQHSFILSDDCKKYSLKSTNVDDNKFSIVLTTNASEITVVDRYDGEDHERQVDKYAIGDSYSYSALDLDGYDVIGESEQQGTADNDKVTITFSYKKHGSADPTPDPTPTPDPPKQDPTPDPTPSVPDDKPGTPSTPSTPDTKPDTKPSTPDVKPDDNPSTPDTKPDESNLKPETIHKMDLPLLLAKGKGGDKQIFLSWLNVSDADGYDVYWSYCDGKHNFKKFATLKKGKTSTTFRKYKKNGKTYFSLLDNNRKYKFFVTAYKMVNGKKIHLKKSNYLHVAMSSSNMTNAKKIMVNKTSVSLVKGKSFTIKPRIRYERLFKKPVDHANMYRYYTTNKKIAKVSQSGKITAKKKGSCYVYVIANNGVYKKIKITVK